MTEKRRDEGYFEKFLDERFNRLHERLDIIERKSDRRDLDVNMLDTTNKAEIHAVKLRVIGVENKIGNVQLLLKAAMWVLVTGGGFLSWALGIWGHLAAAVKGVTL